VKDPACISPAFVVSAVEAIAREKEIKGWPARQEDRLDRKHEPALARLGCGMARRV
jgi:predicted GIY-YIG superfamily endonuclease